MSDGEDLQPRLAGTLLTLLPVTVRDDSLGHYLGLLAQSSTRESPG